MTNIAYDRIVKANQDIAASPHGWIQWKGTDVCMDVYCACGAHTHVDAEFTYHIMCSACGKWWHVSPYVRLVEATAEDVKDIDDLGGLCQVVTTP